MRIPITEPLEISEVSVGSNLSTLTVIPKCVSRSVRLRSLGFHGVAARKPKVFRVLPAGIADPLTVCDLTNSCNHYQCRRMDGFGR